MAAHGAAPWDGTLVRTLKGGLVMVVLGYQGVHALYRRASTIHTEGKNAMSQTTSSTDLDTTRTHTDGLRRVSTETKAATKTTELIAFVVVTVAMLVASQIVDGFDAEHAWFYASLLTIGYMISRGLAKSGSRDFYDDGSDNR
jgi:hypothetical protein